MALSIRDYTIIKVVQASHHQGDIRYGASRGIQCSCMSFMSVSWILFKSPGMWDKFELDCTLAKGDQLYLILLVNLDILGWKTCHKSFSGKLLHECRISRK